MCNYFNDFLCLIYAGELEVQRAKNAVLYSTLTKTSKMNERDNGTTGLLVVTNFRLSFLTSNNDQVIEFYLAFILKHMFLIRHLEKRIKISSGKCLQ